MGLLEDTFVITDDRYDSGCGLQKYRGVYSLCAANKGDSKTFLKWVFPQKFDKDTKENYPGDKAFPMSIAIGEGREDTIAVLQGWIDELKDVPMTNPLRPEISQQPDENDKIPF